tara:strand:+ start:483 stop:1535 length:1053 start_codon:yes stop_codon:yes gene_type:complete
MGMSFSQNILNWYRTNGRKSLPWKVKDPYKIWISEIMLQQTQVSTVIPYYLRFIQTYPNLKSLSKASLDDLVLLWSGLGYYRRVKNIHLASKIISKKYKNKFPENYDDILLLPGIGRTTASAISTFSGFSNMAILDGNVKRILRRFYNIPDDNNSKVRDLLWERSISVTPKKNTSDFIQGMMDIGSLICTRSKPRCSECPLKKLNCLYKYGQYPIIKNKKVIQKLDMYLLLLINPSKKIYLEKIPSNQLWENLHSSPFFYSALEMKSWLENKNLHSMRSQRTFNVNHKVTNKDIKIKSYVYFLKNDKNVSLSTENWYNLANIEVGIPKYMEKILIIYGSKYEKSYVQKAK